MAKYGKNLRFGTSLIPTTTDPTRPLQLATLAETLGLDYVSIQNHPDHAERHDSWTLLTAIGSVTSRISLIANGDDLPARPPEAVAKAAASPDLLTHGRVHLALSSGAFCNPNEAVEGERRGDSESIEETKEAIQILHLIWGGEPTVSFNGKFYQLAKTQPGPAPARPINVWMRATEPHALALAAELADGWLTTNDPAVRPHTLLELSQQFDEKVKTAQRDPAQVQRIWEITGVINDEESAKPFHGTTKQWAEAMADLAVEVGIDTFLLMQGENAEEQLQRFAREVVPLVRELVETTPGVVVTTGLARAQQGAAASGVTPAEEVTDDVDWVDETSMESFPASDPPASSSFT